MFYVQSAFIPMVEGPVVKDCRVPLPNPSPKGFNFLVCCGSFDLEKSRADGCGVSVDTGPPLPTVKERDSIECTVGVIQL